MTMDATVNQMIIWWRVVDRALHDKGQWSFVTSGGITHPHRVIDEDEQSITFFGTVEPSPHPVVSLHCDGEFVTMIHADVSNGGLFRWRLDIHPVTVR